ncbi:hypothetical protein MHTCC0001_17730 [Flavobacteriaceae bacterium MHTCC 0001]
MNAKFKLIALALVITLFNCKKAEKEKTLDEFKFSEKGIVLDCDKFDVKLLNEALFSFENDITKFYGKDNPNKTRVFSQFINNSIYGRIKYTDIVSPHTVKIFEVLKSKKDLWNLDNTTSKLNYNSTLFSCIMNNISDKDLKTTLSALVSTNSMSPKLFNPAIKSNYSIATRDKYLSAYLALDAFYAKLFDVDLTQITEKPEQKVDFNKVPASTSDNNSHAGHDH